MSEPIPLGKLIEGTAERDAVHIAIAPVVAGEKLYSGQPVGVVDGEARTGALHVGIIDPYLTDPVQKGQRCYVCLYPNTVTGMRHHWEHPAFEAALPVGAEAHDPEVAVNKKEASRKWMEEFAAGHYSHKNEWYDGFGREYTADELVEFAKDFLLTGDKHVQQGSESLRDHTDRAEFWKHFEVLTGMKVAEYHVTEVPFCCTC